MRGNREYWILRGLLIALCAAWVTGPECIPDGPTDDSVSVQYVDAADSKIKEQARSTTIIWAGGRNGDGNPLNNASDTNLWNFIAKGPDGGDIFGWYMTYDGNWKVDELAEPVLGVEFRDMTEVTMDVVEAWGLAVAAGFNPPFETWELFKPLNPKVPNPIFAFAVPGGGFVIVDAVTGEVTQERSDDLSLRDTWDCHTECRNDYYDCVDDCRENSPGDPDCYKDCSDARDECDQSCS